MAAQGTILPGVTRDSIIEIARSRGYTVSEEQVPVAEAMDADEVRRGSGYWDVRESQ